MTYVHMSQTTPATPTGARLAYGDVTATTMGIPKEPAYLRPSLLSVEEFARDDHLPHMLGEVRNRIDEEVEHGGLLAPAHVKISPER